MTALDEDFLRHRFPTIYQTCEKFDLNIARDPLPVSPASHYIMGGVRTDLRGRTTLPGLYAAGEVACTGVHGANRLASNSLLEGLVFGARAGEAAVKDGFGFQVSSFTSQPETLNLKPETQISTAVRKRVKRLMWERVGILRDRESLNRALKELETIAAGNLSASSRNFVVLAQLIAQAAMWREESRGGHYRTDFPEQRGGFRVHSIQQLGEPVKTAKTVSFDTALAA
jgi:L-aspartate oxidase